MTINALAGILPAVVFPTATAIQLYRVVRARSVAGLSASSWILFGFANIALYVYAERYTEWQLIFGTLLTALLDFIIAALALLGYGGRKAPGDGDDSHGSLTGGPSMARGRDL